MVIKIIISLIIYRTHSITIIHSSQMQSQNSQTPTITNPSQLSLLPDKQISYSADKLKKYKPNGNSIININQLQFSIKRRNVFQIRTKGKERYGSNEKQKEKEKVRSFSQQDVDQEGNREGKYVIKRSKNYGYVSHLLSVLRKDKGNISSQQTKNRKLSSQLKQQLDALSSNRNQMAPTKIRSSQKSKKRFSLHSISNSKQKDSLQTSQKPSLCSLSPEITQKNLKDYSNYICCRFLYSTQINYNNLRKISKSQALAQLDLKQYKLIQSVNLCLIDSLSGEQPSTQNLLYEYCTLYFANQEKRKIQVVLNSHIWKSFAERVKAIYAYERILYFFIGKMAENELVFQQEIREILLVGCQLSDRFIKIQFQAVSEALSRSNTAVLEAFKSLKFIKQLQKIKTEFDSIFLKLQSLLVNPPCPFSQLLIQSLAEIFSHFQPFLSDSFFHQEQYLCRTEMLLSWKFMHIPPVPFLPEGFGENFEIFNGSGNGKYMLVLGLNKVLVLYNNSTRVLKYRPYMDTFLNRVKECYDIVIFSEWEKGLTDRVIKQIQRQQKIFQARLYRMHMTFQNGKITKQLSKLGLPLSKTIILDTKQQLQNNTQNQLQIPEYKISSSSSSLTKQKTLLSFMNKLLSIHSGFPKDVRKMLKKNAELHNIEEVASIEEYSISINNPRYGEGDGDKETQQREMRRIGLKEN